MQNMVSCKKYELRSWLSQHGKKWSGNVSTRTISFVAGRDINVSVKLSKEQFFFLFCSRHLNFVGCLFFFFTALLSQFHSVLANFVAEIFLFLVANIFVLVCQKGWRVCYIFAFCVQSYKPADHLRWPGESPAGIFPFSTFCESQVQGIHQ